VDCGATIAVGAEPSYPLGEDALLCFECAIRRGGQYDAPHDHWTVPPDATGLGPVAAGA